VSYRRNSLDECAGYRRYCDWWRVERETGKSIAALLKQEGGKQRKMITKQERATIMGTEGAIHRYHDVIMEADISPALPGKG
jgi:hypothetical protein